MVNIRQLQVFKTLCDELNFTKTAEKLNMTQPAVSHVIGSLEEEFGVRLVDRLNRRIYLTTAGKLFLAKAIRLLDLYDDLRLNFWAEKEQQPLRVGSCLTIANFWLPGIIKEFNETCPQTPLQVVVDSAAHIEKLLEDNEIDLALYEGWFLVSSFMQKTFRLMRFVMLFLRSTLWPAERRFRRRKFCSSGCCCAKRAVPSAMLWTVLYGCII